MRGHLALILAGALAPLPAVAAGPPPAAPASDTVPTLDEVRRLLAPEGDRAAGMAALRARAESLPAGRAVPWIQLLASVERTDPATAPVLLEAMTRAEDGRAGEGADLLEGALEEAPEEDRSALLALAARLSQGQDPERASRLRARLLRDHPEALEAPEAALREGRWLLESGGDRDRGLELLEELVVARPNHPLVPDARALLERFGGGGR